MNFGSVWTGLMYSPMATGLTAGAIAEHLFLSKLASLSLIRLFLAFTLGEMPSGRLSNFGEGWSAFIEEALRRSAGRSDISDIAYGLKQAHESVLGHKSSDSVMDGARANRLLERFREQRRGPVSPLENARDDPAHALLGLSPDNTATECVLASRGISYIKAHPTDVAFSVCFWQYERLRCQVFKYLTFEVGTMGLDWFQAHYDRLSALRRPLSGHLWSTVQENESRGICLGALEFRLDPDEDYVGVRNTVADVAQHALKEAAPQARTEFAIVFHFLKSSDSSAKRRPFTYADMALRWWNTGRLKAGAISQVFRRHPESLCLIRGVDIAGAERVLPSWVVLPMIRLVRDSANQVSNLDSTIGMTSEFQRFGSTAHAGEDFGTLHEGLRRIHEFLEFGGFTKRDRLGHALALSVNPKKYWEKLHRVPQTRADRVDDLLWEYECYKHSSVRRTPERESFVKRELGLHLSLLYGNTHSVAVENLIEDAARVRRCLFDVEFMHHRSLHGHDSPDRLCTVEHMLWTFLRSEVFYARGQEFINLDPKDDHEHEAAGNLQAWLSAYVSSLGATIEANPSSNLLLMDHFDLAQHPAMASRPPEPATGQLSVSINSDDPLTFATCLSDEFAHFYLNCLHIAKDLNVTAGHIETARLAGWDSRFSLPDVGNETLLALAKLAR